MPSTLINTDRQRGSTKLNAKQKLFVECYLADNEMNATKAAKKAGYTGTAAAAKLMLHPGVQAEIGKAIKLRIDECRIEASSVLRHLQNALYLDPLDLFEPSEDGSFRVRSLEDVPVEVRRCVTKLKAKTVVDQEGNATTYVEIELMSKDKAMELALRHLGLLNDKKEVTVKPGEAILDALLEAVEDSSLVIDANVVGK